MFHLSKEANAVAGPILMGVGGAIIGDDLLNRYQAFTCPRNEKGEPDRSNPIQMVSMRTLVGAGILGLGAIIATEDSIIRRVYNASRYIAEAHNGVLDYVEEMSDDIEDLVEDIEDLSSELSDLKART